MAWEDSYERQERFTRRVMIAFVVLFALYLILSVAQVALSLRGEHES